MVQAAAALALATFGTSLTLAASSSATDEAMNITTRRIYIVTHSKQVMVE